MNNFQEKFLTFVIYSLFKELLQQLIVTPLQELHDADINTVMVTGDNILTAIRSIYFFLKKPLHFKEEVKCQNRQKWFYKGLNWVSRAVLSPDDDDVGIFLKIHTRTFEKSLIL